MIATIVIFIITTAFRYQFPSCSFCVCTDSFIFPAETGRNCYPIADVGKQTSQALWRGTAVEVSQYIGPFLLVPHVQYSAW